MYEHYTYMFFFTSYENMTFTHRILLLIIIFL